VDKAQQFDLSQKRKKRLAQVCDSEAWNMHCNTYSRNGSGSLNTTCGFLGCFVCSTDSTRVILSLLRSQCIRHRDATLSEMELQHLTTKRVS